MALENGKMEKAKKSKIRKIVNSVFKSNEEQHFGSFICFSLTKKNVKEIKYFKDYDVYIIIF